MIPVDNPALYSAALEELSRFARDTRRISREGYRGRFVQIFLGLKYWQQSVPGMFSGQGIEAGPLQTLLDDLYSKTSRPANASVVMLFEHAHLARTGLVGAGNRTPQNTWRNNFHLQKGIGCYAEAQELASVTFLDESRLRCRHLRPAIPGSLRGATCELAIGSPRYRGEDHRKWLKIDASGSLFSTVDLMLYENFVPWVAPAGHRIPVIPLIIALYHDADPGLTTGARFVGGFVDIQDFITDFGLSSAELAAYFDDSPANAYNATLVGGPWGIPHAAVGAPPTGGVARRGRTAPAAGPTPTATLPPPILTPIRVAPPAATPWWDAELLVAEALQATGWTVYDVSRQQLGYDLLAQRGRRTIYVDVKSSGGYCSPTLTAREWQQASVLGVRYFLGIVENFNPSGVNLVYWVSDPATTCVARSMATVHYSIPRSSWTTATVPAP